MNQSCEEFKGIEVIKHFFGTAAMPVSNEELLRLTKEARAELARGAASQLGLAPVEQDDGSTLYVRETVAA